MRLSKLVTGLALLVVALVVLGAVFTLVTRTLDGVSPALVVILVMVFVGIASLFGTNLARTLSGNYW